MHPDTSHNPPARKLACAMKHEYLRFFISVTIACWPVSCLGLSALSSHHAPPRPLSHRRHETSSLSGWMAFAGPAQFESGAMTSRAEEHQGHRTWNSRHIIKVSLSLALASLSSCPHRTRRGACHASRTLGTARSSHTPARALGVQVPPSQTATWHSRTALLRSVVLEHLFRVARKVVLLLVAVLLGRGVAGGVAVVGVAGSARDLRLGLLLGLRRLAAGVGSGHDCWKGWLRGWMCEWW